MIRTEAALPDMLQGVCGGVGKYRTVIGVPTERSGLDRFSRDEIGG